MKDYIKALVNYGVAHDLIHEADSRYVYNPVSSDVMHLERGGGTAPKGEPLTAILTALTDDAVRRGLIGDSITERDLFDTRLMGELTPFPHEVHDRFVREYAVSPERGTDWFYNFCGDVNYIRRDRLARDIRWVYESEYGPMNITINLSKPGEGPPRHRGRAPRPPERLPQVSALRRERGLRRPAGSPRAAEPAHGARPA